MSVWSGSSIFNPVVVCGVLLKLCRWDRSLPVGIKMFSRNWDALCWQVLYQCELSPISSSRWLLGEQVWLQLCQRTNPWLIKKMCLECNIWKGTFYCLCIHKHWTLPDLSNSVYKMWSMLYVVPHKLLVLLSYTQLDAVICRRVAGVFDWSYTLQAWFLSPWSLCWHLYQCK